VILHVVAWRLKEAALGNGQAENARLFRAKLEALRGRIPGLRRLDVALDFSRTESSSDVVLVAEFDSREALAAYQIHPEHQAVVAFAKQIVAERRLVDGELD